VCGSAIFSCIAAILLLLLLLLSSISPGKKRNKAIVVTFCGTADTAAAAAAVILFTRQEAQQGQRCDLLQQAQPQVAGAQPAAQEGVLGGRQALGEAADLHQGESLSCMFETQASSGDVLAHWHKAAVNPALRHHHPHPVHLSAQVECRADGVDAFAWSDHT
jgi:uncharacterized protein YycO